MKVQSTQKEKPQALEFGTDTVYIRNNIKKIQITVGQQPAECWEYDEVQHTYQEYAKLQQQDNDDIKIALVELASIVGGVK